MINFKRTVDEEVKDKRKVLLTTKIAIPVNSVFVRVSNCFPSISPSVLSDMQ
jgi:hypothetical protein